MVIYATSCVIMTATDCLVKVNHQRGDALALCWQNVSLVQPIRKAQLYSNQLESPMPGGEGKFTNT